jgi:hypothetical protein
LPVSRMFEELALCLFELIGEATVRIRHFVGPSRGSQDSISVDPRPVLILQGRPQAPTTQSWNSDL